ncbi:MAG: hypothetical protein U5Q44_15825 [Dehalococcoidia bacterium]|nr:hypothetical protein [Dehalococcoidia bacterium]
METVGANIVHLVRGTEGMSGSDFDALRTARPGLQVMVTIPVRGREALYLAESVAETADFLLLDSAHPETGNVGATGHTHDWEISREIVEEVGRPVFLAGGLGPENVAEAIRTVHPAGVDSETRTSRRVTAAVARTWARVRAFVDTAKATSGRKA